MCGIGALKYAMLVYLKLGSKALKSDSFFVTVYPLNVDQESYLLASLKLLRMIMSH